VQRADHCDYCKTRQRVAHNFYLLLRACAIYIRRLHE
jgi:hypothetical protein